MNAHPFALYISWTCYANWLPGDERGHVSNTLLERRGFEVKRNVYGTPYAAGDQFTHGKASALQEWPAVKLDRSQAVCVAAAFIECCAKRDWFVLQAAVMANHCHVVVTDCPEDGPAVRRVLKGNAYAALKKLGGKSIRQWTAGGSDRYKFDDQAIANAVGYLATQEFMLAGVKDMNLVIPS